MGTLLRRKNKRVIGKASLCDRGLTETRPSPSASARKTRIRAGSHRQSVHGCPPLPPRMEARHSHSQPQGGQTLAHVAPPGHSTGALRSTLALTPFTAHPLPPFCPSAFHLVFVTERRLPHSLILQALCICSSGNTEYHSAASLSHWVSEQGC